MYNSIHTYIHTTTYHLTNQPTNTKKQKNWKIIKITKAKAKSSLLSFLCHLHLHLHLFPTLLAWLAFSSLLVSCLLCLVLVIQVHGWLAGWLAGQDGLLPFFLRSLLFVGRYKKRRFSAGGAGSGEIFERKGERMIKWTLYFVCIQKKKNQKTIKQTYII